MISEAVFTQLIKRIVQLERVVQRQQMRMNNMIREAKVLEVDPATGMAIVDAHGIVSPPIPWLQQAGDVVDWEPPRRDQRMMMFSPNGDMGRGFLLPGGFTEQIGQPYQEGAMFARMIGATKLTGTASGYMVETPTFTIKANVLIEGDVQINGSSLRHNDKNIGSTHTHVTAPPGPPGVPS